MKAILVLVFGTQLWAGTNLWTPLGPDGGGANLLAVDPLNPSTLYASTNGGIFKSSDGGSSWQATGFVVQAACLTVDPQVSGVLYACDGPYGGLFKSVDGGSSWKESDSGLDACANLFDVILDPQNPSTVYAASRCGLFKSVDGGANWQNQSSGLGPSSSLALAIDPQNPNVLYAATNLGAFKSTDGGVSWNFAGSGLPPKAIGPIAVDPQHPATLFLSTSNGLFKSTDGAQSWSAVNSPAKGVLATVVFDPQNSNVLYGRTSAGIFKSTNGGTTWTFSGSGLPTNIHALTVDPLNPATVYAASDDLYSAGVFKSTDAAATWNRVKSGLKAIGILSLLFESQTPAALYATIRASPYATTQYYVDSLRIIRSANRGQSWTDVDSGALFAIDPSNPSRLYANVAGRLSRSTDGGKSWNAADNGLPRCGRITSVVLDPRDSSTVYAAIHNTGFQNCACASDNGAGGAGIWNSGNGGASWSRPGSQPRGCGVAGVTIDPQNSGTLYAWNGQGLFQSTDKGNTWTHLRLNSYVGMLAIDPQNPNTLYAAEGLLGYYTVTTKVFKSSDRGATWSEADSGIPPITLLAATASSVTINTLVVDPHNTGAVYAGTLIGVFRTKDGGASWTAVNDGLANLNVHTLAIDPGDSNTLYAGTDSGGFVITFLPSSSNEQEKGAP